MIKTKIIQQSIKSLQAEGLRFSIDLLAKELKISKKTIYKYFKNKEALAMAIYEKFYL
ncbi:MAG TPA: TetR/AcrR family transcriptional regulator, partial [Candidatus Caccosoma faecigallinarum]|nr:TetR/AcrR family transcriptional regulator [Candidatus Caccosoma faecigallinarum]